MRSILLFFLGVPIPIIILIALFVHERFSGPAGIVVKKILALRTLPLKHKCPLRAFMLFIRRSAEPAARHLNLSMMFTINHTRSELAFTTCHHQRQVDEAIRESPFVVVPRQNFDHIAANHQR